MLNPNRINTANFLCLASRRPSCYQQSSRATSSRTEKVWLKRIGLVAGSVKGPWSPEEDALLSRLVAQFGARNWGMIAQGVPGRSSKSCRLRWCNQLDPCLKRMPFTGN
ncbi:Transcription factor MYB25 [Glycine max]|nr:Transcription factor MYB25 [Glycine max]